MTLPKLDLISGASFRHKISPVLGSVAKYWGVFPVSKKTVVSPKLYKSLERMGRPAACSEAI